jgi:superfamily I DNA/RNA helicase
MLMVNAYAGTGKTTTVIFGLGGRVPKGMILSNEQKEIIKVMRSYKWQTAAAMAFNTSIADELKRRVPPGVVAATSNSFGNTAWKAFAKSKIDGSKTNIIFRKIAEADGLKWEELRVFEPDVVRLVSLLKGHLLDGTEKDIVDMAETFNIELNPQIVKYTDLSFQKGIAEHSIIDFDDQIFMPIKLNLPIPQYDLVVVDESQDLNFAKQELAMRMARKWIVAIGDSNQAIYGFSGADSASMSNLNKKMASRSEVTELKLTITRRCPKKVVAVANRYVPDLRAHKDAPEGEVRTTKESFFLKGLIDAKSSRMVLCRTNAPLTSLAFKLIANKRRCFIQGKDIGAGLVRLVEKAKGLSFQEKVAATCEKLTEKILAFKGDILKADKIEALEDKIFCIKILSAECESIEQFKEVTEKLFKNKGDENDHILSSVHKAKGLEHKHVCIYKPSKLPMILSGKKKQSLKQIQQEYNLAYVAYTRSQDILEFIEEEKENRGYRDDEEV